MPRLPDGWAVERMDPERDLDAVLAIEAASFTNPWTREMYLAELENHDVSYCFLVRNSEGEVAGFCSFWRILDELHINNLAVAPEWRGSGAGTALMNRILAEGARMGARRATLEVRRSNEAALRLYQRLGFSIAGVRRDYYSQPVEDALVLWRDELGSTA